MKCNKWTLALAGAGVVSFASVAQAEEAQMSQVLTSVSSTQLSGYVDTSAIWKFGTGNDLLPGRAYDGVDKLDGFNFNVASLTLEKPLSEEQWAAGYTVQMLLGPDAVGYNVAVANNNTANNNSDFGVKQAYVALRTPIGTGIDWKIGTFNTIIGYESFESVLNPNYSRSFGWQLEPTQHTGLLGTYKASDAISFSAGVANTWNAGINARASRAGLPDPPPSNQAVSETEKTYMASLTITAPESWGSLSGSAFYAGVVDGLAGGAHDTTSLYTGATFVTPVEGLSVGAAFDYRLDGVNTVTPVDNWAYALAAYVSFQASEKWKLNGRVDFSKGSDGTWYASGVPGGDHNEIGSLTLTADYQLWANVISRAEFRWDRSFGGDEIYGLASNPDRDALTLAANIIYKF